MSVRSRIDGGTVLAAKAFGGNVPQQMQAGEAASQMTPASPFSPGEPIGPYDGFSRTPRTQDFTTGYNIATRPRSHERVGFDVLKGLIGAYDVADICIWHRIDSIRSLKWKLIAADGFGGDITGAIPAGLAALRKPDQKITLKTWLAKYLYDVLAYDAGTLYRMKNRAGKVIGLKPVDGTSIAPLLDYWGDSPKPPAEAYVQYVQGLPWNWLTRDDLIYEPFRPHTDSPYGHAPIETIILNANTDIRFQLYFLQRFTEGNIPEAFAAAPESWSPQQIEQFQEYWDTMMYGDQARKHQIRWMPSGSKLEWSNEKEFTDSFSLFLMRKTCASFHVVPSDLGFTESVNRSSGESQADVQHRVGDLPLMEHVEGILSAFLAEDLGLPLQFQFDRGEEQADQLAVAQSDDYYIKMGVVGASEVREMRFGLPEPDGIPVPRFIFSSRAGPIPLSSLKDVAGPVDMETGAPEPGAELPHKEFQAVEGTVPVPPPPAPALAEREYGPEAIPPLPPTAVPVAKEGDGGAPAGPAAGITSETGVYGYDGPGHDDEDPVRVQSAGTVTVAADPERASVAKEMTAFRRFRTARRRAGAWRDFTFEAVPPVLGHRLNDAGRLAVRKAAGEIAVAGLAVQALDTGRVLMLQRALSDDDPAAGTWEFPGGHLEGAESPLQGAWREWAEETGAIPPAGQQAGSWTSPNGVYQGIVWSVPSEQAVPVRADTAIANPDDPDGDCAEAIAWWNPADLPGNTAVRPELLENIDAVMAALGCSPAADCCGAECCTGGCCDGAGACGCGTAAQVAKAYPDGQGYGSHAFRPSGGTGLARFVCWYCGMAASDPNHRNYQDGVAKAGGGPVPKDREWPGWKLDHRTVAHWAPLVRDAVAGVLSRDRLNRAAAAYLTAHRDQDGSAPGKRDRNTAAAAWLAAWLAAEGADMTGRIPAAGIITDAYLIGAVSAAAMVAEAAANLAGWKPGLTGTARDRIADLGLAAEIGMLITTRSSQVADEIAGGFVDALARDLAGADGDMDAGELGSVLAAVVADEDVAAGFSLTQICIYTGQAAQDYYCGAGGVSTSSFAWVVDPALANCAICLANQAADARQLREPWPSGDLAPPIHYKCRCQLIPDWA